MLTHWSTEPIMNSQPYYRERRGPQIYVHVEFGISWAPRETPKNREITYRSRGLRDRSPNFPRQVPAPNTNYLAAIHSFQERRSRTEPRPARSHPHPQEAHHPNNDRYQHQMQEYYQADTTTAPSAYPRQPQTHTQANDRSPPAAGQEQQRRSRAESQSSHERGHSAPPPVGDNPWDVSILPQNLDDVLKDAAVPAPDQMKALPAEPSRFRLGEDGLPWSAWSWPFGYDPSTHSHETAASGVSARSAPTEDRSPERDFLAASSPISVFSPGPALAPPPASVRSAAGASASSSSVDTGRVGELEALSAAMMTVDNGFENQWWNTGQRKVVAVESPAEEAAAAAPRTPDQNRLSTRSLGWAVANTPTDDGGDDEHGSLDTTAVVSPMTNYASPSLSFQPMHRSMSTRSEELWFTERGS